MIKEFPLVSIMIPTYNQEAYISDAIESALAQDYPNLEVVVTDDCSTDHTAEVVKQYLTDSRLKYHRNTKNLGRVGNYHNTLYNVASGEWVVNLDGDDYFTDNKFISIGMSRILENEGALFYFARKYLSPQLKKYKSKKIDKECFLIDGKHYFLNYFKLGGFSHAGTIFNRQTALLDRKCYTFPGIQSDFHGIIRYTVLGKVIIAHHNCFVWRVHKNNATTSVSNKLKYKSERKCQFAIIKDLPSTDITKQSICEWIDEGKSAAKRQFIYDELFHNLSLSSLKYGLINYLWDTTYTIIYLKSILRFISHMFSHKG